MRYGYARPVRGVATVVAQTRQLEAADAALVVLEARDGLRRLTALGRLVRRLAADDVVIVASLAVLSQSYRRLAACLTAIEQRGATLLVLSDPDDGWRDRLAAAAAQEQQMVGENLRAGRRRAIAGGVRLGRPTKLSAEQRAAVLAQYRGGETPAAIARCFGVSRTTVAALVRSPAQPSTGRIAAEIHLGFHLALDPSGNWQTMHEFHVLRDSELPRPIQVFRLADGRAVDLLNESVFEVVATGERLVSVW